MDKFCHQIRRNGILYKYLLERSIQPIEHRGGAVINVWHITGRNNYAYQYQVSNRSSNFHNWIVASTRLHRRHRVRLSVLDIFRNCVILDIAEVAEKWIKKKEKKKKERRKVTRDEKLWNVGYTLGRCMDDWQ